jgi:hypothetical protein
MNPQNKKDGEGSPPNKSAITAPLVGKNPKKYDPGAIRTRDPQLRRLMLYPTELRGLVTLHENNNNLRLFA